MKFSHYCISLGGAAFSLQEILEARVGFEPTDGGFADLSLRPLGYRAVLISITEAASRELLQSVARVSELPLQRLPAA